MLIPVLIIIYFLSRIYFINAGGVFFDSPEYLHLFSLPNFLHALTLGHRPSHFGYILLFWPIFQIASVVHGNGGYAIVFVQIIVSILTLYCFYKLIAFITDKNVALVATIITALLPLYWIITDTIMMENAYISFFFISIYFLILSISKKNDYMFYTLSLLFLILAIMTHAMVIFWLPFLWCVVFYKKKKIFLQYLLVSIISSFFGYLLYFFIMTINYNTTWQTLLYNLSREKDDMAVLNVDLKSGFIVLRDYFILQMRNYTSLLTIMSLASLIVLWKKDKMLFILSVLWIAPALYINLWWDVLFPGRYASLSGFGIAFLSAYLIRNHKTAIFLVFCYLLLVTLPAVNLLRQPIPYLEEAKYVKQLPKDSLLIESHFSRPQVQQTFKGELVAINEHFWTNDSINKKINLYLTHKKPVFISSAALTDPYGLYTGPYLHFLSLSYTNNPTIKPVIEKYTLKEYKIVNSDDNLIVYRVISRKKSPYPQNKSLKESSRRIDYYDPLWRITNFVEKNSKIQFLNNL